MADKLCEKCGRAHDEGAQLCTAESADQNVMPLRKLAARNEAEPAPDKSSLPSEETKQEQADETARVLPSAFPPQLATPPVKEKERRPTIEHPPGAPLFEGDLLPAAKVERSSEERLKLLRLHDPDVNILPVATTIICALLAVLAPVAYLMLHPSTEQQVHFDEDMRRGRHFYDMGNYQAARKQFDAAMLEAKKLGESDPRYTTSLIWRARVALNTSNYDEAKNNLLTFLSKTESADLSLPDKCEALCDMGVIYSAMGEYSEAKSFFDKALTMSEKSKSDESGKSKVLHGLALLALKQNQLLASKDYLLQALSISRKEHATPTAEVADITNDLGKVAEADSDFEQAEKYFKEALQLRESALNAGHPDIADSLICLGGLYNHNGRIKEAEAMFDQALKINEAALGKENVEVAESLLGLGLAAHQRHDEAAAAAFLKQSLDIRVHLFGPTDPKVVQTRQLYNEVAGKKGRD